MARPQLPDVKVDDLVMFTFDRPANFPRQLFVVVGIVQRNRSAVADQAPRPARDDKGADNADHRVEPDPAVGPARQKRDDRQNGRQRVGENMEVGRAQVVVSVPRAAGFLAVMSVVVVIGMFMMLVVTVAMMMVVVVLEQPGAEKVHQKTQNRHEDRLVEADRNRTAQPHKAFPADQEGDDA